MNRNPVTYNSEALYVESKSKLCDKIAAIETLIDQMFAAATKGTAKAHIEEYSLDTGQSRVKTTYRDPESIMAAISIFERQKNYYINQLNGRGMRLVDGKNFRKRR